MPATGFSAPPGMPDTSRFTKDMHIVLFLICISWLSGCSDIEDYGRSSSNNTQVDTLLGMSESIQPEIEILEGGRLRTRATAPRGIVRESQGVNKTELYGPPVHVEVYDSLGRVETRIECNEAAYNPQEFRFEFFGDVRVRTGTEATNKLRTERLIWDEEIQEFSSDGFVIITTPADSITGYGFSGTQDLSSYSLGTVTGEFSVE